MIRNQLYILFLPSLFCFTLAYSAQQTVTDELTKQGIKIVGAQVNDIINYGKEQYGILTPIQKAQQKNVDAQTELANKQIELNEQQKILNEKQIILTDKQIEEANLDTDLKKFAKIKEICSVLPKDDKKAIEAIERLRAELDKVIKDFPAPEEKTEPKKNESPTENNDKKIDDIKAKSSLFAMITASCCTAATKTGHCADFLAGYSFAYITSLDCFKDTFISKHAKDINRALVGTTLVALTYAAYKLYKIKTHVDNDDDLFNDDNDY